MLTLEPSRRPREQLLRDSFDPAAQFRKAGFVLAEHADDRHRPSIAHAIHYVACWAVCTVGLPLASTIRAASRLVTMKCLLPV